MTYIYTANGMGPNKEYIYLYIGLAKRRNLFSTFLVNAAAENGKNGRRRIKTSKIRGKIKPTSEATFATW